MSPSNRPPVRDGVEGRDWILHPEEDLLQVPLQDLFPLVGEGQDHQNRAVELPLQESLLQPKLHPHGLQMEQRPENQARVSCRSQ